MRPAAAGSSNVESFTVCTIVNQRLRKAAPPQHDFRLLLQCGHQVARKPREQPLKSSQAKPPCPSPKSKLDFGVVFALGFPGFLRVQSLSAI